MDKDTEWMKIMADDIRKISQAMEDINNGPLSRKAVLVLLANKTGLSQKVCEQVLDGLSDLKEYLNEGD